MLEIAIAIASLVALLVAVLIMAVLLHSPEITMCDLERVYQAGLARLKYKV